MATVAQLTAPYTNLLLRPEPGDGVCERCWNLTDGYRRCYACARGEHWLAIVTPISYSVAYEQVHHVLAGYKRWPAPLAAQAEREIAAVLWRHLLAHERCQAAAAGVESFDLVTTVPAGTPERDRDQPLRRVVGGTIDPVRSRDRRLLVRSEAAVRPRTVNPERFVPTALLEGQSVLLIDDTWTSGASAQSAAAALLSAGAGPVAALVVGRHVNRDWHMNDRRLRRLARPFDWDRCVHCAAAAELSRPCPPAARTRS